MVVVVVLVVFDPFDISIQSETAQIAHRFLANKFLCCMCIQFILDM